MTLNLAQEPYHPSSLLQQNRINPLISVKQGIKTQLSQQHKTKKKKRTEFQEGLYHSYPFSETKYPMN